MSAWHHLTYCKQAEYALQNDFHAWILRHSTRYCNGTHCWQTGPIDEVHFIAWGPFHTKQVLRPGYLINNYQHVDLQCQVRHQIKQCSYYPLNVWYIYIWITWTLFTKFCNMSTKVLTGKIKALTSAKIACLDRVYIIMW